MSKLEQELTLLKDSFMNLSKVEKIRSEEFSTDNLAVYLKGKSAAFDIAARVIQDLLDIIRKEEDLK